MNISFHCHAFTGALSNAQKSTGENHELVKISTPTAMVRKVLIFSLKQSNFASPLLPIANTNICNVFCVKSLLKTS